MRGRFKPSPVHKSSEVHGVTSPGAVVHLEIDQNAPPHERLQPIRRPAFITQKWNECRPPSP